MENFRPLSPKETAKELGKLVDNEIDDIRTEEPLKCYECGETIEDEDETYIQVSESPDEWIRAPFCRDCADRLENKIIIN